MVEFEEVVVDLVIVYIVKIEDNVNSVVIEEKDDVVISVGFEEKCDDGFLSRDLEIVEGIVIFISEVESDGAVISVGIEIREGFLGSEEVDGFQRNIMRMGCIKEIEGIVTCIGVERRSDNFVMCLVIGVGLQEERMVIGVVVILVDNNILLGISVI